MAQLKDDCFAFGGELMPLADALAALNDLVLTLQQATDAGTAFVFGYLGGGPLPFEETQPGASFVLAFRALPLIIVVGVAHRLSPSRGSSQFSKTSTTAVSFAAPV